MMKKVLYGVAMALLACGPVCTLQSCKDDVSDLKTQTEFDLDELRMLLQKQQSDLSDQLQKIGANRYDINKIYGLLGDYATVAWVNGQLEDLQRDIDAKVSKLQQDFNKDLIALATTVQSNGHRIKMLEEKQVAQFNQISNALKELRDKDAYLTTRVDQLYDLLGNYVTQDQFGVQVGRIDALWGKVQIIEQKLPEIEAAIAGLPGMREEIEANARSIQKMKAQIYDLKTAINNLRDDLELLKGDVTALTKKVDDLTDAVKNLTENQERLITSILIQRAISPVFGDLSLPIGIKSNILFNWYGLNDNSAEVPFPNVKYSDYNSGDDIKGLKLPTLKGQATTLPVDGFYGDVKLGKVYVTVNPSGHNFNGTNFSFVASNGEALPFNVSLEASNEKLYHGYTRADEDKAPNNFYEGEITVNEDQYESIELKIDDQLKSAMEAAIKDQSKRNAASLIKALYDQMSHLMPAYGLRYDWTAPYTDYVNGVQTVVNKPYAVTSQYDLAVATARPLGFNFLNDFSGFDKKVPTINNLDNFIQEMIEKNLQKLNIEGKDIEVNNKTVGFKTPSDKSSNVTFQEVTDGIQATIKGLYVDGKEVPAFSTVFDKPEDASGAITSKIVSVVKPLVGANTDKLEAEVEMKIDIVLLQMQQQINDVVADLNGQIKDTFNGMGDSAQSYIDKANRLIDLYNKVANKINNVLQNPNHYLQAAAFYMTSKNVGILSGDAKHPTTFVPAGGDAFSVLLSTYSAEIVVPVYQKYVAVTGVYENGKPVSGVSVDAINNAADINEVIPGETLRVKVPAAGFDPKYVYEFTYQALDYRGFTSTKKFYVQVAK